MKKSKILFVMMIILSLIVSACGGQATKSEETPGDQKGDQKSEQPTESKELTFGAATIGGFWYVLAGALGEDIQKTVPGTNVTVVEGGSIANLKGLEQGIFQIGLSNGQTVPEALNGVGKFEQKAENIRTIASLYPNIFYIVVREDSDIHSIEDLKGKAVTPGIKGYSGELAFQQILEIHGLSYEDLPKVEYIGTTDGGNLLRDGHVDALVGMLDAPNSTITELDTTVGIRLIPIPEETVKQLQEINNGYLTYTVKGGTYPGVKEDTLTVAGYSMLLVNKDLSDDMVYTITKTLIENKDKYATLSKSMKDFNAEFSAETMVGPIHPGAEKYYNELGLLKK
jgi:TRAP transporter TAXI family solute receptor